MSRNPDVQRLLASLREGGLIGSPPLTATSTSNATSSGWSQHLRGSDLRAADSPDTKDHDQLLPSRVADVKVGAPRVPVSQQPERISKPVVPDSSLITTWPAAVKFVSKYIMPNESAAVRIKLLITEQHKHERDWWEKRELIIRKHTGRAENQQKAADLLRALGGQYIPVEPTDPQVDLAELEAYDIKVHRILTQMVAHQDRELRQIGVPFFAIRHTLVISEKADDDNLASQGRLGPRELRELQQRIVIHLEDLFGEDNRAG